MIHKIHFIILLAAGLLGTACVREIDGPDKPVAQEGNATIRINTRAPGDGEDERDFEIVSLRVMAFNSRTHICKSNKFYDATLDQTIRHEMYGGEYHFVFLANEPRGGAVQAKLDEVNELEDLDEIAYSEAFFVYDGVIPMIQTFLAEERIVSVHDDKVKIGTAEPVDTWQLSLERLAARIDITLTSKANLTDVFTGVQLSNLPNLVPLTPGYDLADISREHAKSTRNFVVTNTNHAEFFEPVPEDELPAGIKWGMKVKRLILPSSLFSPATAAREAVKFTVLLDAQYNPSCTMGGNEDADPQDFTLPRNYHLIVDGHVETPLKLNIQATQWTPVGVDADIDENRTLNVSDIAGLHRITPLEDLHFSFSSNQPEVVLEPTATIHEDYRYDYDAITLSDYYKGLTGDKPTHFGYEYDPATGMGTGFIKLELRDDLLPSPSWEAPHTIVLNAGGLRREIAIQELQWFIHAAPGMVGIRKSDRQLTLRGSNIYADYDFAKPPFSPFTPESEPVYAVYFKWGSLIAMVVNTTSMSVSRNTERDIVWAPDGYGGRVGQAASLEKIREQAAESIHGSGYGSWKNIIPYGDMEGTVSAASPRPVWPENDPVRGIGDPCAYADASGSNSQWMTPETPAWKSETGIYPFGATSGSVSVSSVWRRDILSGPKGAQGALAPDGSVFLPEAGNVNNGVSGGALYWSRQPLTTDAQRRVYVLDITDGKANVQYSVIGTSVALTIRCVRID